MLVVYTAAPASADVTAPLARLRARGGVDARLVVVGLAGADVAVADPEEDGTLDVVGFDAAAASVSEEVIRL